MTEDNIALAKRLVACKSWRWMPGMRAVGKYPSYPVRIHDFGENVQDTDDMLAADKWLPWQQPTEYGDHIYEGPYLPDLTDPATLGCLISLIQEYYNKKIVVSIGNGWWSIQADYQEWDQDNTSSILEALTLAMESR